MHNIISLWPLVSPTGYLRKSVPLHKESENILLVVLKLLLIVMEVHRQLTWIKWMPFDLVMYEVAQSAAGNVLWLCFADNVCYWGPAREHARNIPLPNERSVYMNATPASLVGRLMNTNLWSLNPCPPPLSQLVKWRPLAPGQTRTAPRLRSRWTLPAARGRAPAGLYRPPGGSTGSHTAEG